MNCIGMQSKKKEREREKKEEKKKREKKEEEKKREKQHDNNAILMPLLQSHKCKDQLKDLLVCKKLKGSC